MARLWPLLFTLCTTLLAADGDWWRGAVLYEIVPRSGFAGDLNGVTASLDYLKDLGVDAISLAPFYPSPLADLGNDISDFRAVDPQLGTLADFDRLVAEAEKRGIHVLTSFALNHTSDQHPWFKQSKSSRANPKADWYIWRDAGAKGQAPNNWQSMLGHSAWSYGPARKQYYYHAFAKDEPDLNFRNRTVRDTMYDNMRFWLDRGVSGFRLDGLVNLFEDTLFRDEAYLDTSDAVGERMISHQYTANLPELQEVLHELRQMTNEYPGRVLIGADAVPTFSDLPALYGRNRDGLHLPIDWQLGTADKLTAEDLRRRLLDAETGLAGNWPMLAFEDRNHPHSLLRYGDGVHNDAISKLLATLLLTARGTAWILNGEENDAPAYYKRLIHLRRENEALRFGDFVMTSEKHPAILSYLRQTREGAILVAVNCSSGAQTVRFDLTSRGVSGKHARLLAASFASAIPTDLERFTLPPFGSFVGQIEP